MPTPYDLFALEDSHCTIKGSAQLGTYVVNLDGVIGDVTNSLQSQINYVSQNGGGTLMLPRGSYLIEGSVIVKNGVRLTGAIDAVQSWENTNTGYSGIPGTLILATGGENEPDANPLFTLKSGSSISGISVYYPNQIRDTQHFKSYPWTIFIAGNDCTVENITLYNSYNGVKVGERKQSIQPESLSVYPSERHRVKNVFGTVLKTGVWIDYCTDVGRIENVHIHPEYWGLLDGVNQQNYITVQNIMLDNLTAYKLGWTDWEYISNTFVFSAKIAYHFVQSVGESGVERKEMNGEMIAVGFDKACTGFQIDYLQRMGISVTNGQFVSNGNNPKTAIEIKETCNGSVRFTNCIFWGEVKNSMISHSSTLLSVTNCYFLNPKEPASGEILNPVISVSSGRVQVSGSSFETNSNRTHIRLTSGVSGAIVTSNNGQNTNGGGGGVRIENFMAGAIIANNE